MNNVQTMYNGLARKLFVRQPIIHCSLSLFIIPPLHGGQTLF